MLGLRGFIRELCRTWFWYPVYIRVRIALWLYTNYSLTTFAGQITGATPPIPGMFPNMFPLGTGQVCITLVCNLYSFPSSHLHWLYFICSFAAVWCSPCYASSGNDSAGWQEWKDVIFMSFFFVVNLWSNYMIYFVISGYQACSTGLCLWASTYS